MARNVCSVVVFVSLSMGLSLALILFFKEGFALWAIGGDGNICLRYWLFFINFQCLLKICLILWILFVYYVMNTSLFRLVFLCQGFFSFSEFDTFNMVDYLALFISSVLVFGLICMSFY